MSAFLVAQLADLLTFLLVARIHPTIADSNPVAAYLYESGGPLLMIFYKAFFVTLFAWSVSLNGHPRFQRIALGVGIGIGLFGALSNTLAGVL